MLKKILVALLSTTVLGAGGAAAYTQYSQSVADLPAPPAAVQIEQSQADYGNQSTNQSAVQQNSVENVGEAWQAKGQIVSLDDFGMQFRSETGSEMYVELGPPDYWQNQGIEFFAGQPINIVGFANEGQYHAAQVMLEDGQTLRLRNELGQPLWSGGVDNGQNGSGDGSGTPQPQTQVDEWITYSGLLIDVRNGTMSIQTDDGQIISFQTGQPRFFQDQGVSFVVGDAVAVTGFYEGGNFSAGDILQIDTGLRVMLRDPNGRPLWAGPGSNGNGGNSGNGGGNGQ